MPLAIALEKKFGVRSCGFAASICEDLPGYFLEPHTDTPERLLTGIFYLPEDDRYRNKRTGTILYKGLYADHEGIQHSLEASFTELKEVPYVANSALFFLRSDWSYHGVRKNAITRRIMSFDLLRWWNAS